ncbi:CHAP domain-containing protein [Nocardia nepalensis]|uniref:CHAP domain-containing protein n=1 Tax=Nocardia nepalensis TaxID=3375448 RepID=UPI003B67643F
MSEQNVATRSRYWWPVLGVVVTLVAAGVIGIRWWQDHSSSPAIIGERLTTFPAIDRSALDPTQVRILTVLEREFDAQDDGRKYAEGVDEPWCADFVSWVMREAGVPLANPNSGSWRIPGVYTLQEYYQGADRFVPIGSLYPLHSGDVLFYSEKSPFSQHTNIVLAADGAMVTTIGGNEFGEVAIHRFPLVEAPGVLGFGRL